MLSMFTRHTGNNTATSTDYCTTQNVTSKRLALHSALAICIAGASLTLLSGCGGSSDATTRNSNTSTPPSTVRTAFFATITSPVELTNVRARAFDSSTGNQLDQIIITRGTTAALSIPVAYIKSNNIILLSLEPIDSSSSYYDPMLANGKGHAAKFNQTLHALISMNKIDTPYKVDPFSEMAYQRALIRTGTFTLDAPKLNRLTIDQLNQANNEISQSLGTQVTAPFVTDFNSVKNIASQHIYNEVSNINTTKTLSSSVQSFYFGLAQLALYAQNNPSDPTPYLNFGLRAALDLRDGDLDGMTTFGGEADGTVKISNPILYSGVVSQVNSDPDHNDILSLINVNLAQRNARGDALKIAGNHFFDTVNAALSVDLRMDADTRTFLQTANYAVFKSSLDLSGVFAGGSTSTYTPTSQIGAGNYTKAFGLPSGINLKNSLDASDLSGRTNDIIQLAGIYKNSNGCQLKIGFDGSFEFGQGSTTYRAVISRDFADSLVRISGTAYRLNIITGDVTAPAFIQIMTNGAQVLSAVEGRSTQLIPTTLDTTDLSCTF